MPNDPVQNATLAVAHHAALAPILVFFAGLFSCFGPCVAPRFLAIVSCADGQPQRSRFVTLIFVSGLVAAYGSIGGISTLLGSTVDISNWTFFVVGFGLICAGVWNVTRAGFVPACRHEATASKASLSAIFLLGASFAFVLSPCCTPLVAAIVAYSSQQADPIYGASLLAAFGLGHGLPVAVLSLGAGRFVEKARRIAYHQATSIVSGSIMVALGAFYACLA